MNLFNPNKATTHITITPMTLRQSMEAIANNDYALIMLYLRKLNLLTLSNSEFIWAKIGEAKI